MPVHGNINSWLFTNNNVPSVFGGYAEFTINNTNYYYLETSDFGGEVTSGYIEASFYYDGSSTPLLLFTSADIASNKRYFQFYVATGNVVLKIRHDPVYNLIVSDDDLSIGWHIVRAESTGSAYLITVDGLVVDQTATTGLNDGKWIGDIGAPGLWRDNISIGAYQDNGDRDYSAEFLMKYVDFNNTNKWVASDVG